MKDAGWGLCKDCKWWQIEPSAAIENTTMGLCIDEKLLPFQLRVSGISGCNRFMGGDPAPRGPARPADRQAKTVNRVRAENH